MSISLTIEQNPMQTPTNLSPWRHVQLPLLELGWGSPYDSGNRRDNIKTAKDLYVVCLSHQVSRYPDFHFSHSLLPQHTVSPHPQCPPPPTPPPKTPAAPRPAPTNTSPTKRHRDKKQWHRSNAQPPSPCPRNSSKNSTSRPKTKSTAICARPLQTPLLLLP